MDGITFDVSWPTVIGLLTCSLGLVAVGLAHIVDVAERARERGEASEP